MKFNHFYYSLIHSTSTLAGSIELNFLLKKFIFYKNCEHDFKHHEEIAFYIKIIDEIDINYWINKYHNDNLRNEHTMIYKLVLFNLTWKEKTNFILRRLNSSHQHS